MASNFYDEFIKADFFEKTASENQNIKNTLGDLSPEVLEKLANEISGLTEDPNDMTLEDKIASECDSDDKKEDTEEKKESSEEDDKKEDTEEKKESSEDEDKKEDTEEKKESSEDEDDKKEDTEEKKESSDEEDKKEDTEEKKESSEDEKKEDAEEKKESSEDEDEEEKEVVKQAYELAEQKLLKQGYTVADYVFQKCANEGIAYFIAENAEKLASLSERSTLQVADDILDSLNDLAK